MLEALMRLLVDFHTQGKMQDLMPLISLVVHSKELEDIVRRSATPMDDVLLRVLRVLIPAPNQQSS